MKDAHMTLTDLLAGWIPGSFSQPWTWDDEEDDIRRRECCCRSHLCAEPNVGPVGHYQAKLEAYVAKHGIPGVILLGNDGRVWDGHHRVIAARTLGLGSAPVEFASSGKVQG